MKPKTVEKNCKELSHSFYGITAMVDESNKLHVWEANSSPDDQSVLELQNFPTLIRSLRHRSIRQVFVGKDIMFALGEDMQGANVVPTISAPFAEHQSITSPNNTTLLPNFNGTNLNMAATKNTTT